MPIEYLLIFKRRFSWFISIVIISMLFAVICGLSYTPRFASSVVMTFAIEDVQDTAEYKYSNFYAEQAALEFTRTISGWYKDPMFRDHIFKVAELDIDEELTFMSKIMGFFSAKRLERQNILTTYSATTDERAKKLSMALEKVIEHRLSAYNNAAQSKYKIAYVSNIVEKQEAPWALFIIGALMFGVVLGVLFVFQYEKFKGAATISNDVEKIFGKKSFDRIFKKNSSDQRYFRMRMLEESPFSSVVTLAKDHKTILAGMDIPLFNFPNDVAQLKNIKSTVLVIVELGITSREDMYRAKNMLESKKWEYVILR